MLSDFQNVYRRYTDAKTTREQYKPLWDRIAQYVAIGVKPDYLWNNQGNKADALDRYVDDPTSAISVNQAGDYMMGILWGTGERAVTIKPSRYVTEEVDETTVKDFYSFATSQLLYQMNHADAGLNNAMRPYMYDQFGFGTSGVGAFKNSDFMSGVAENCFIFSNYGVDNMAIDEGRGGSVDTVFVVYHWRLSRILGEFCTKGGEIDPSMVKDLPKEIQKGYQAQDYNREYDIVFGFFPRSDYAPKLKGKRGARYRGVWFMESGKEQKFFFEEDFKTRPISVGRQIKVRGEVWGRASGTILISSISSVNFMFGESIEVIEKMNKPPLGITSNALFGDTVLDTSSDGLTVLNSALADAKNSIFPLIDVGNPADLIQFLIPYLDKKITTGFKVDALLDFNSDSTMTATESLQRYAIRGKSLSGMLLQQKTELLSPLVTRCLSIMWDLGQLGVNSKLDPEGAKRLKGLGKGARVLPQAVIDVASRGLPWFELRFNNELEKLTRTEAIQNLVQIIQAVTAISAVYPNIVHAVKWYDLLSDINDNLDSDSQILLTADEFKGEIMKIGQAQQTAIAAQAGTAVTQMNKNMAQANESNANAQSIRLQ